ncbi:proline-rich protein 9 [Cavia porcellus]|uniref:proline-rich protein 9 n=1 Tax=Cavia porcellus TaxID=10141 RepID=UPI0000F66F1B|nr:proline-rich protein 9 [Cavia porcellus]
MSSDQQYKQPCAPPPNLQKTQQQCQAQAEVVCIPQDQGCCQKNLGQDQEVCVSQCPELTQENCPQQVQDLCQNQCQPQCMEPCQELAQEKCVEVSPQKVQEKCSPTDKVN